MYGHHAWLLWHMPHACACMALFVRWKMSIEAHIHMQVHVVMFLLLDVCCSRLCCHMLQPLHTHSACMFDALLHLSGHSLFTELQLVVVTQNDLEFAPPAVP